MTTLLTTEPVHPELGRRLHDTLIQVVELEETFQLQHQLPVHDMAPLRVDERIGNAASGFNTASTSIAGAIDQLRTWYQVVATISTHPLPVFSHYTLARAAYEPSLLVLWLLDADIDSTERIGRGFAAQLRSLEDMRKFQNAAGMAGDSANAPKLYKRLFDAARAAGYVTTRVDGTERLSVGVPDMVGLFNQYDPAPPTGMPEWLYRFLSGNTHAREWALMRGAYEAEIEGYDTGMNMIRVDLQTLCYLADRTVSIVSRAVAAHIRYRTHPQPEPPPVVPAADDPALVE